MKFKAKMSKAFQQFFKSLLRRAIYIHYLTMALIGKNKVFLGVDKKVI